MGTLLVVGIPSEPLALTAASLVRSGVRIVPSRVASRRELREVLEVAARGEIRTEIRRYGLEEADAALETVATGRRAGRAVLDFEGSK
jgi:propanol-preferring alcohol dehydrogenase